MEIPLAFDSYPHKDRTVSAQVLVNMYAEVQPPSSKAKGIVRGSPGIEPWMMVGDGPIRGGVQMNGTLFLVSGQELWTITSDGTRKVVGYGIRGTTPVSIDQNGFEVVVTNGEHIFSYLASTGSMVQVTDPFAYPAATVTYMNGIFVFDKKGTNQFFPSEVMDGRTYDGLKYQSAESKSDNVMAVKAYNGFLYVFGAESIEIFDYTGAADLPFSPIKGGVIPRGIASPLAIAAEDSSMFIMGEDGRAYRLGGQTLRGISNPSYERLWQSFDSLSDCFAFVVPFEGRKTVYFTFPSKRRTFGYDISSGFWHERSSFNYSEQVACWRASFVIQAFGKVLVGDGRSNRIGVMKEGLWTEFGDPIIATMITPPVYNMGKMLDVPTLMLDMETGIAQSNGQGSDPKVIMSYSRDGGYNFSNQREGSLGRIGEYGRRIRWAKLGSGYQYVFKFQISDPVSRTMTGLRIEG